MSLFSGSLCFCELFELFIQVCVEGVVGCRGQEGTLLLSRISVMGGFCGSEAATAIGKASGGFLRRRVPGGPTLDAPAPWPLFFL